MGRVWRSGSRIRSRTGQRWSSPEPIDRSTIRIRTSGWRSKKFRILRSAKSFPCCGADRARSGKRGLTMELHDRTQTVGRTLSPRILGRLFKALGVLGLTFGLLPAPAASAGDANVQTTEGMVEGVTQNGITSFLGIPYAAPPVGALRWRAPQPPSPHATRLIADHFGHDCIQNRDGTSRRPARQRRLPLFECLGSRIAESSQFARDDLCSWRRIQCRIGSRKQV